MQETLAQRTDDRCVLVTLADEAYVEQAKQLFSSVYWNAGWRGDYLLLSHEIPDEKLRWFRDKGIRVFLCTPLTKATVGESEHSSSVLSKFYVFSEYFKQWDHVIFLDADIIVRASLDELAAVDGFAAPEATSLSLKKEFRRRNRAEWKRFITEHDLSGKAFNTGVLAFSTDVIDSSTFGELTGLFVRWGHLNAYGEEGTLNLFFSHRWRLLPIIYNSYPGHMHNTYLIPPRRLEAAVVHFVAMTKPWDSRSPFHEEWSTSLKKAEMIDMSRRQPPKRVWSEADIERHLQRLRFRFRLIGWIHWFWLKTDWTIGQVGRVIKRASPKLYEHIRLRRHD